MSTSWKTAKNPFPGLRPFETDEYKLFFGREGQSDELIARLERSRFLAVVGTSGSGKSSLIRAGLMPALRGGMMKGAGSGWRIAVMRPGGDPIGNLAAELVKKEVLSAAGAGLSEYEAEAVIEATLRSGSLGIVNVVRQARLNDGEKLLVVVDQFEELFRFRAAQESTSADEALAFVKLLLEASQQRERAIYIVLTMRSDFLGDCAQFQGLPEAINDGQYLIPRMTRDERRFAVSGPVGVTRGKITEPLVNRLLNDVGDNPDQLPILQHALMRTWDYWQTNRRNGEPIGLEHYEAIGTMSEALSRHADEAFNELPDERSRHIAEILFKALSERGADNREIRRPTRLSTICNIAGPSMAEVIAVIDVFRSGGRSFLMPPAGTALHTESVIDISHESLIRNWERLKKWVDEEALSVRIYRRLAEAAVLHREGKEALLQNPALQIAADWREKSRPNAAWAARYHPEFETAISYLDASFGAMEAANLAAEAARVERERQREEVLEHERREREQAEHFATAQARANRKLRVMMVALVGILLFAVATAAYALVARSTARKSAREALALRDEAVEREKQIADLLDKAKRAEAEALNDKWQAVKAQEYAKEQAKLAALRESEAVKAQQQAKNEVIAKNKEIEIDSLNRTAVAEFRRGDFEEAEQSFNHLTSVLRGDQQRLAWAKSNLGAVRRELGKLDQSIADLSEAKKLQQKGDNKYFDTITWLGLSYSDKGQYELAEPLYLEALKMRHEASTLEQLARNHNNQGEIEEAQARYNEALDLRRQNRYSPDLTAALKEVAEFQLVHGDAKAAIKLYEEALITQDELEADDPNIALTFNELARAYEETEFPKRVLRLRTLARQIRFTRSAQATERVTSLERLAMMYVDEGRFNRAGQILTKANKIFLQTEEAENQGSVNHFISFGDLRVEGAKLAPNEHVRSEWFAGGQLWYERALEISQRKGFHKEVIHALDGLAALRLQQRDFAEAEQLYKQTLEIREKNPGADLVPEHMLIENFHGLAMAALGQQKFSDAEAYLLKGMSVVDGMGELKIRMLGIQRIDARLLRHLLSAKLGDLYANQNRLKEADEQFKALPEKLKQVSRDSLTFDYHARHYLEVVQLGAKFYTSQNNVPAAESFYKLVWPEDVRPVVRTIPVWPEENYKRSILALAPDSCVQQMIEILNSYNELLEKAQPTRNANIEFGLQRLRERLQ
jgi:tetratricopeptide (TPR) repeat protein/energy-coupling factor transporter ATP-binding protein EcfA2